MKEIIRELEEIARGRLELWPETWTGYHWPGYTWEHTLRVRNLALRLAREAGADTEVVELAAVLHDIEKPAGDDHAHAGAETAREILSAHAIPTDVAERAVAAIATHAGENTRGHPIENRVLGDADFIDANFGLVGTWRFVTIRAGHGSTIEETIEGFAEWLNKKDEMVERVLTDEGAAVARERNEWMHQFCAAAREALVDDAAGGGLLKMIEHINANYERGSIFAQLPELLRIAEVTGDGALTACRRLQAEIEGEA